MVQDPEARDRNPVRGVVPVEPEKAVGVADRAEDRAGARAEGRAEVKAPAKVAARAPAKA